MMWLLVSLTIAAVLVSHVEKADGVGHARMGLPVIHAAPDVENGSSCNCVEHGTQTSVTAARVAGSCSAGTCVCPLGHIGKFCDGTEWRFGHIGQSCTTVCADVALECSDWRMASNASMIEAAQRGDTRVSANAIPMEKSAHLSKYN